MVRFIITPYYNSSSSSSKQQHRRSTHTTHYNLRGARRPRHARRRGKDSINKSKNNKHDITHNNRRIMHTMWSAPPLVILEYITMTPTTTTCIHSCMLRSTAVVLVGVLLAFISPSSSCLYEYEHYLERTVKQDDTNSLCAYFVRSSARRRPMYLHDDASLLLFSPSPMLGDVGGESLTLMMCNTAGVRYIHTAGGVFITAQASMQTGLGVNRSRQSATRLLLLYFCNLYFVHSRYSSLVLCTK